MDMISMAFMRILLLLFIALYLNHTANGTAANTATIAHNRNNCVSMRSMPVFFVSFLLGPQTLSEWTFVKQDYEVRPMPSKRKVFKDLIEYNF